MVKKKSKYAAEPTGIDLAIGLKIVRIDLNPFQSSGEDDPVVRFATNPHIHLNDGSYLYFITQETGDYGVEVRRYPAEKKSKSK